MKRLFMVIALTVVLFTSALAGDVPSVGFATPPPDGTTETTTATALGDIPSDGSAQPSIESELVEDAMGFLRLLSI